MKKIFIIFSGPKINQQKKRLIMDGGFECWNLSKYTLNNFVSEIKKEIPLVNKNVESNYQIKERKANNIFGITEKEFESCSWGLLAPDNVPGCCIDGFDEIMFIINLYSSDFLYPIFYVSDFGFNRQQISFKYPTVSYHDQNKASIIKRKKFVKFYNKFLSLSVYGSDYRARFMKWSKEDWRLFIACLMFDGLKKYSQGKDGITWQRESADLATILESLFTAGESDNEMIGYKLRKRASVLAEFYFKDIESDIKDLYNHRSKFVHGSLFLEIAKKIKIRDGYPELPLPQFDFLNKQTRYVRYLLIAYLNLHMILKRDFSGYKNVIDLLEEGILDITLRKKIISRTKEIYNLL